MELRHLRYFVAVAEELSFTRAAKRLGINQPPLSAQIRQLEEELGAPLFRRQTRGVELTDAGNLMLEEARIILRQVERAKTGVARRARGETGRINVGFSGATCFHPLIPTIILAFAKQYPEIVQVPEASNTSLLTVRVAAGAVDLAFVRQPTSDHDCLIYERLVEESTVMVLPAGHRLNGSVSAPLSALAKETFVMFPRVLNPHSYDAILAACRHAGFTPRLGQEAPPIASTIPLVAAGFGVAIVPQTTSNIHADGVIYLPIEGNEPGTEICLAYRRHDRSLAVRNFVAAARRQAREFSAGAKELRRA